jgi:hypothetical protein
VDASQVSELALKLNWTERLELAQRLLESLHPQTKASAPAENPRKSIQLPNPTPSFEAKAIKLESVSVSFQRLRDALESNLES